MSRKFLILGLLATLILTIYGVLYALTPKTGPNLALEQSEPGKTGLYLYVE